jgi:uncharacterized membrane protein YfcA
MATLAATFVALVSVGAVTRDMLPSFPVVALSLVGPSMLGARIYKGLTPAAFRRVILLLLLCAGAAMLAASLAVRGQ